MRKALPLGYKALDAIWPVRCRPVVSFLCCKLSGHWGHKARSTAPHTAVYRRMEERSIKRGRSRWGVNDLRKLSNSEATSRLPHDRHRTMPHGLLGLLHGYLPQLRSDETRIAYVASSRPSSAQKMRRTTQRIGLPRILRLPPIQRHYGERQGYVDPMADSLTQFYECQSSFCPCDVRIAMCAVHLHVRAACTKIQHRHNNQLCIQCRVREQENGLTLGCSGGSLSSLGVESYGEARHSWLFFSTCRLARRLSPNLMT